MKKIFSIFILIFIFASSARAQDASGLSPTPDPTLAPASTSTSAPKAAATAPKPRPAPVISAPAPKPTPTPIISPVPANIPTPEESNSSSSLPWLALGGIAVVLAGAVSGFKSKMKQTKGSKSKDKKNDQKKCLNFKKLMQEKFEELKDWKGQAADLIQEKGTELAKEGIGGRTEELINLIENGQKEYQRLQTLFEKCIYTVPNKKTAFIFHGTEGDPEENWFPWMKAKLEAEGCRVFVPQFPTPPLLPIDFSKWHEVFKNYEKEINADTVIIGHSSGALFTLQILENLNKPVKQVHLVATPLEGMNFNWENIKNKAKEFTVFQSDNDPYVGLPNGQKLAENLGIKLDFIPNAGHFNTKAGYTKFPELLNKIKA